MNAGFSFSSERSDVCPINLESLVRTGVEFFGFVSFIFFPFSNFHNANSIRLIAIGKISVN